MSRAAHKPAPYRSAGRGFAGVGGSRCNTDNGDTMSEQTKEMAAVVLIVAVMWLGMFL